MAAPTRLADAAVFAEVGSAGAELAKNRQER
jgi:hypothetical protein